MSCSPSSLAKYKSRPGPPIPATLCTLGEIKLGNDGNKYQIVEVNSRSGLTNKWQKCGTGSTNCKLVKSKKQTKSEALKLRDEVYKTWDKVAKKSKKRYDDEEYLIPHPDGLAWGYGTDAKYLDWEYCVAKERPKRECNKIVTMLKQDLSKMNKALEKINKSPVKVKKSPVKVKKSPVKVKKSPVKVKKSPVKVKGKTSVKYSSMYEWRKNAPIAKKFNKMAKDFQKSNKWDYKLAEQYNLEERVQYSIFDKKNNVGKKTKKVAAAKKDCSPGKVVNPKTGRCINALKKIDSKLTKSKAMSSK